ncbi:hypothetical protein [Pseudoalteromonas luteoviolacea]|uniref:Uncharacterized protein n=1 Tax=Pseudoalteromonas luteoviolacea H33 TaxID=1365251 RepID=A0A167FXR0_9GAMM|nr:hypothetical protein [Pseudoalteromonas luteoviolacea]KZN53348.1 hypothetical protein N476_08750 [Pseudoalteromonas luteoviolacea H33]KZN76729.1 hypothetical protein N477_14890 [Pseudoalteromonas luteoviolacea H33-S]MBQ4878881.1 hypothetical protein [Pseudoalteromonas luteoviolacea]MBQ4907942.1 hypothetical protein [Pseudoalteromonas luteoviolacea]
MKLTIKKNSLKKLSNSKVLQPKQTHLVAGGEPELCPTNGLNACFQQY